MALVLTGGLLSSLSVGLVMGGGDGSSQGDGQVGGDNGSIMSSQCSPHTVYYNASGEDFWEWGTMEVEEGYYEMEMHFKSNYDTNETLFFSIIFAPISGNSSAFGNKIFAGPGIGEAHVYTNFTHERSWSRNGSGTSGVYQSYWTWYTHQLFEPGTWILAFSSNSNCTVEVEIEFDSQAPSLELGGRGEGTFIYHSRDFPTSRVNIGAEALGDVVLRARIELDFDSPTLCSFYANWPFNKGYVHLKYTDPDGNEAELRWFRGGIDKQKGKGSWCFPQIMEPGIWVFEIEVEVSTMDVCLFGAGLNLNQ